MKYLDVPSSGSIADRTHSHNRAGQYTRNRRAPVQPVGTGRRATVRANFGAASAAWKGLTAAQQAAWDSFALDHPITDSLGQSIILTGHQCYVRVYASAINTGLATPTGVITDLDLPAGTAIAAAFSIATGIAVTWTAGAGAGSYAFALSRPMSSGRRFNKTFWQPPGTDGYAEEGTEAYALTTAKYAAEFGAPVVGQRVFLKMTPVSAMGWNGQPFITQMTVVA